MKQEKSGNLFTRPVRFVLFMLVLLGAGSGLVPELMPNAQAATFTVTNTNNSGAGSLRQAMTNSNANAGKDTIDFQIGSGAKTITLITALPDIMDPVIIDGTTQPGYNGIPLIELNGVNVTTGNGLNIYSGNTLVKGLVINRFGKNGIVLTGGKGVNVIVNCYIGTNASGTSALGNGGDGINIQNSSTSNQIGDAGGSGRNVISGNKSSGIGISTNAGNNLIYGNYIGLNAAGTAAVGNDSYGIRLFSSNNTVGAPFLRNVISGNGRGIDIASGIGNAVKANSIGLNAAGTAAIGNNGSGLEVNGPATKVGGAGFGEGNLISGNTGAGIDVGKDASASVIVGNKIGTNPTGTAALGNSGSGINLRGVTSITVGGTTAAARNIISGNGGDGISIDDKSSFNKVTGNYVGTDVNGTAALGNNGNGVALYGFSNSVGGPQAGERNVLSSNGYHGVAMIGEACHDNVVQNNRIGTDVTGSLALGNKSIAIRMIEASNNTIGGSLNTSGNVISGNLSSGISIEGPKAAGNKVRGNYIGTNHNGTTSLGNKGGGVVLSNAPNNTIGGTQALDRNIISGNEGNGVALVGETAQGNVVQNNRIGTDAAGSAALGNKSSAIRILDAPNNVIGGVINTSGNVISGNLSSGVSIEGSKASGNKVQGNYIGTNHTGTVALGNKGAGVNVSNAPNTTIGGPQAIHRNIISGNESNGVTLVGESAQGNVVQNNRIGTDTAGFAVLGNGGTGIRVLDAPMNHIGGVLGTTGNVISGNGGRGITIEGAKSTLNVVQGNCIGTNNTGSLPLGNKMTGIDLSGSVNLVGGIKPSDRNIISGNEGGVVISKASANVVHGNYIGLNAAGDAAFGNGNTGTGVRIIDGANNTIGGTEAGMRNVISGNYRNVTLEDASPGNLIQGNYIGTDATGTFKMSNQSNGVLIDAPNNTIGGPVAGARNVISGHSYGVLLSGANATGNNIQGNYIGTKADGTGSVPNYYAGVFIRNAYNNMIGGTEPGAGNLISGNDFNGLYVVSGNGNAFLSNSMHSNASLGIDLVTALGVNTNDNGDPDFGPNLRQNYPILKSVTTNGNATNIQGQLNSNPNKSFRVEVFSNMECDPSGFGEGKTFMGAVTVTTDASGNAPINAVVPVMPTGNYVTVTATSPDNNTSEFSPCALVGGPNPGQFQFSASDYVYDEADGAALIVVTRSNGNTGKVTVNYKTTDGSAVAGEDYETATGTLTFEDGEVIKTFSVPLKLDQKDEGNQEEFLLELSNPTGGAVLGAQKTATMYLIDYDMTGPVISFSSITVVEGDNGTTDAVFTINASPHSNTVVVDYETEDGTAKAGEDYEAKTDSVTFSPGELSKTVTIKVKGDAVNEGHEVFSLKLNKLSVGFAGDGGDGCVIIDDDGPKVQFAAASSSVNESDGKATITVNRIGSASGAVSVNFAAADVTAKAGEDYTLTPGTLNFANGETSKTFEVQITDDPKDEPDETLKLNLSNPTGNLTLGTPSTLTLTIVDNDLPLAPGTLQFAQSSIVVGENGGQIAVTVSRTGGSGGAVSVQYAIADGTAQMGEDYTATPDTLTFANGETSKTFAVQITNDGRDELDETVQLNLINPTGGADLGQKVATLTITDDDPAPAISINDVNVNEGNSGLAQTDFKVTLAAASGKIITVDYATVPGGTGLAGDDYQPTSGTLTFNSGETSKTVTVLVKGDPQDEPNDTFFVALSNVGNATISKSQGTGTIINDDAPAGPTFGFSQASYSVAEGLSAVTVTVTRTGDTSGPASVDYTTSDDTATQKSDYGIAAGTLNFVPGESSRNILVLINQDMHVEGNESFKVMLSNPSGAAIGQPATTINITDNVPESLSNPIDDAQAFVHTHYHDFLNREPDAAGLAFWTNEIASCGNDVQCIEVKRINVSAAYFLSIEFQQTGYLLYLFQKESFASMPKYNSFMRDLQEVSQGVIVNSPGWEQKLAANQQQFAEKWVNRQAFKATYDGMSNAAYVNALYANAGIAPPQAERDALVTALDTANQTRAAVLMDVAANTAFRQQEQNPAFVLMQYFGYLRRDPDSAPDSDLSGYYFWLNKLNNFNGDYLQAEMVKAFLTSIEYRQRFGQ